MPEQGPKGAIAMLTFLALMSWMLMAFVVCLVAYLLLRLDDDGTSFWVMFLLLITFGLAFATTAWA
jgi:hypothetical protein